MNTICIHCYGGISRVKSKVFVAALKAICLNCTGIDSPCWSTAHEAVAAFPHSMYLTACNLQVRDGRRPVWMRNYRAFEWQCFKKRNPIHLATESYCLKRRNCSYVSLFSLHNNPSAEVHCCSLFYLRSHRGFCDIKHNGFEQRSKSKGMFPSIYPDLSPLMFFTWWF